MAAANWTRLRLVLNMIIYDAVVSAWEKGQQYQQALHLLRAARSYTGAFSVCEGGQQLPQAPPLVRAMRVWPSCSA